MAASSNVFGDLLRRHRIDAGLTQEELCTRSNISEREISDLERGVIHNPHLGTLRGLVKCLNLSGPELVEFETAARRHERRHNLPAPTTSFIGRQGEVKAISAKLDSKTVRLLTLTGPGGVGKTRLAMQAATELLPVSPDGVWLVKLESVADHNLVISTIAATLGVKETAGQRLEESLAAHLRERHLLLLLDNFEHLLPAAPLLTTLLQAAPRMKLLVTSRAPLHLYGEHEFPVSPLEPPTAGPARSVDALVAYPAVLLFVERAQAVQPNFALTPENAPDVEAICTRLDGLPLAIELAAARSKQFTPAALLRHPSHRLPLLAGGPRDVPARQRTLRATTDWSYDLLPLPAQRRLFARCAVFAGGWTASAAEQICAVGDRQPERDLDIADALAELAEQSLLLMELRSHNENRFHMLVTIREYALERLEESGEREALQRQHAAYYLALAEEAEPQLTGAGQVAWLARLEEEHDNLRAALHWAWEAGGTDPEAAALGLRMAGVLFRFWDVRGYYTEGREHLAALLAVGPAEAPGRATALAVAGLLAWRLGDYAAAQASLEESAALAGDRGEEAVLARARYGLGMVAIDRGAYGEAQGHLAASLDDYRALDDRAGAASALHALGTLANWRGENGQQLTLTEDALALRRALGDTAGVIESLNHLGVYWRWQGEYARARAIATETLAIAQELGDKLVIGLSLANLGYAALIEGDLAAANGYSSESLALFRELGHQQLQSDVLEGPFWVALLRGNEAAARAYATEQLALARKLGSSTVIAGSLLELALAYAWAGEYAPADALLAESRARAETCPTAWGVIDTRHWQAVLTHWQGPRAGPAEEVEAALVWFREHGARPQLTEPLYWRGRIALAAGEVATARDRLAESLALAGTLGQRLFAAWGLAAFAEVEAAEGAEGGRLARLAGAAEGLLAATTGRLWPVEAAAHAAMLARVRAGAEPVVWEAAWAEGQAMTLAQAIAYALDQVE